MVHFLIRVEVKVKFRLMIMLQLKLNFNFTSAFKFKSNFRQTLHSRTLALTLLCLAPYSLVT